MLAAVPPVAHPLRRLSAALAAFGCAGALLGVPHAAAQGTIDRAAQTAYQKEAAACRSQTRQDRATCMKEAAAARDEARRGRLDDRGSNHGANAAQRCNALPEADRKDCLARVQGQGTTSGSVDGGGIYRETVTRTPGPTPPPTVVDTTPGAPKN